LPGTVNWAIPASGRPLGSEIWNSHCTMSLTLLPGCTKSGCSGATTFTSPVSDTPPVTPHVIKLDPGNSLLVPVLGRLKAEITIAQALGARDSRVLWMTIRRTVVLGGAGVIVGTAAARLVTRLLETFMFETRPTDPATFIAVALMIFVAAILAGVILARRVTRVDPLVALRHE
jgi:hypothetical protein